MAYYEDIIFDHGQVKCNLCSIPIQDDDYGIECHVNGNEHKELEIKRMLLKHSVMDAGINSFYCRLCEVEQGKNIINHLQSQGHRELLTKIRNLITEDGSFLELPETHHKKDVYCILCDRSLDFKILVISDHINSAKHRRARAVAVQPFNGIFSVEGDDEHLWCKFCQRYIDNYIEVILNHIDGDNHVTKMARLINLIKDKQINIEKYLLDPKEDKARCEKCEKNVACNMMNLESHIKGKIHTK